MSTEWSLDGEPPAPATWPEAEPAPEDGSNAFTGTDPDGRAIGPAEDPSVRKVADTPVPDDAPVSDESSKKSRKR